ncbi:MAG: BMC domain-containing protein [Calditrichaeota bacterium]|nr:MAG: BMC domain-containing protein [Calditrichota bacterium]
MKAQKKHTAIGLIEVSSIAAGKLVTDTLLKTSNVQLLLSRSICSGKYMVMISGAVAEVKASVDAGVEKMDGFVIDSTVIANIHPDVLNAISGTTPKNELISLGIIESFSVASLIKAADEAAKSANVELLEIRLAMALGGKAFVTLTGHVSDVQLAVDRGADVVAKKGLLVNKVVIPAPRPELFNDFI